MQKNTEYGAMAILSASSYGNPDKINDGESTTGNKSGIYIKINVEWVSAGEVSRATKYPLVASKYKDDYKTQYVRKIGDAITETNGWHGNTSGSQWFYDSGSGLVRSFKDSVFSYNGRGNNTASDNYSYFSKEWRSRAVVVVGKDL